MIDPDMRQAIFRLHQEGMTLREISRRLKISRNSVRKIVQQQGAMPNKTRRDKIHIDPELLRRLHAECDGWMQRIHEKLTEEEGIQVSYSTLTHLLREMGLGKRKSQRARCDRVPDEPGAEMQHDTTVYHLKLSGKRTKVIASMIYLRYSKRRYLKFYRVFNRFAMKCFLHEALMFWGYSAKLNIIDNTNLARLRGSGSSAVIVPEMFSFAERYGFQFVCHAIRHANRKAGEERGFWTVETNFLKGRAFQSMEDLNRQAFTWATERIDHRPLSKSGLIPAKAFEHERHYLTELPSHLPAPYLTHERETDQYGYVALGGNYYWVPGSEREAMKVLQYADRMKIFRHRECVAEYPLPADGVKNERFSPAGQPKPRYQPKNRHRDSRQEEERLRAIGPEVGAYLDYAVKTPGIQRHRFMRELFALSRRVTRAVFVRTLQRALRYRVAHLRTLERIAWFCMSQNEQARPEDLDVDIDEDFRQRPAYQEGCLTDEPDLSAYDEPLSHDGEPGQHELEQDER
jgi:transposase